MADYYSILKKTISGLPHNSQGTRTIVYGKAKAAIDKQLRAIDPPLSQEAIDRQMGMLEASIAKLDAEFTEAVETGAIENAASAPSEPPKPAAPELVEEPTTPPIIAQTAPEVSAEPIAEPSEKISSDYVPAGSPVKSENSISAPINEPAPDPQGMEYSETILAADPDTQRGDTKKPGRSVLVTTVLPIVLVLGLIGGGVYALWQNKDDLINALFGDDVPLVASPPSDEGAENTKPVPTPAVESTVESTVDEPAEEKKIRVVGEEAVKNSSQLTTSGDTVIAKPVIPPVESIPATPAVELPPTVPAISNDSVVPSADNGEQQVTEIGEDGQPKPVQSAQAEKPEAAPSTKPAATPSVAQKAFLYEEGSSGGDASRDNAAVIWSLGQESIDNGPLEAVIKGQLDVPGRNMTMNLVIKRNSDASLPASHIIEIQFVLPNDFTGGNISNVSRFVMKTSEQARGEGLVAVPAKISDGNFLIALNNLDQALATNRKLLLNSSWIDVPMGYTTGRRALVTLEKGALGTKVFRDAFADWDKR